MGRCEMKHRRLINAFTIVALSLLMTTAPNLTKSEKVIAGTTPVDCNLNADSIIQANDIPLSITISKNGNSQTLPINKDILSRRGYVAYGSPFGSFNSSYKEYRYLGYTIDGKVYTNPDYPPDVEVQYHVGKSWTKHPWNDPVASKKLVAQWGISDGGFNNEMESDQWLADRLISPYPSRPYNWLQDFNTLPNNSWKQKSGFPWNVSTLKNYGVIVSPPGKFVWGTFVMFNTGTGKNDGINSGGDWYQDFLIEPDILFCGGGKEKDLYTSYVDGGQYEVDVPISTRVKVGLSTGSEIEALSNVTVSLFANGSLVGNQVVSLTRGVEKSLTFNWTPKGRGTITLRAEINPPPRTHQEYWSKPEDVYGNNVKTVVLTESSPPPPINGTCNINDPNSGYSRGISGKYYYSCPPCNEDGCSKCIGYYFEELWVDMLTPKPTVVQAGQGTAIEVKTTYDNDNPAHEGKLYGASQVIIQAPNTDDWPRVVMENQPMVPAKPVGSWVNNWKPPYAKFDGEGNWTKSLTPPTIDPSQNEFGGLQRWYFGFDVPDGEEFNVFGKANAGYKNSLNACDGYSIRVEGTPTDDYVIRTVDPLNPFPTGDIGKNWLGYDYDGKFYDYTDRIKRLTKWYSEPEEAYKEKVSQMKGK